MANETMYMSHAGFEALRQREHAVQRYYNDMGNNCTYGIGTVLHLGPCTEEEMQKKVTIADVNAQLAVKVRSAEFSVKQQVTNQKLTQEQFDSLVSFTYNVGRTGARTTLDAANRGKFDEVVRHMNHMVFIHPRDAHGHRQAPIRVQGLVNRRNQETIPFQPHQAQQ